MGGAGASDARARPWPFSAVRASDADAFVDALGGDATRVLTRAEDVKKYSVDWMGKYVGASAVVVLPRTTEEVSKVMRHCHARRIAVVPQGGNTGLVGGGTSSRPMLPCLTLTALSTSSMTYS